MKEFKGGFPSPHKEEPWEPWERQLDKSYKYLDFLAEMSKVTEREISEFKRDRIVPIMQEAFNKASISERIVLVAVDRLPRKKFNQLKEIAKNSDTHLMAIHDAKNTILSLRMLTQDDKYMLRN